MDKQQARKQSDYKRIDFKAINTPPNWRTDQPKGIENGRLSLA